MSHPADPALRHRVQEATLTLRRPDGLPLADTEVVVEQVRHTFPFANIGFDFIGLANDDVARPSASQCSGERIRRPRRCSWTCGSTCSTLPPCPSTGPASSPSAVDRTPSGC